MEEELASLNIIDEEEAVFRAEAPVVEDDYKLCMVGRCLIDCVAHFPSLRNTMTDLWYPIGGISISDLSEKRPMDLAMDREEDLLMTMEWKKRQRLVRELSVSLNEEVGRDKK
ncbi:hypothetical protein Goshw_016444 [Gossypium schwendimanii]|uniref:Uncharacterized protein n=1 Tax=Gossypium schwendimanii TaxID=34291 RepID=A0A7J9KTD3_GOSSC|nr:hypothetical protein [Gossypium schwendimanii]